MKRYILFEIVSLFVLPVVLLTSGVIPMSFRFLVLGVITLFVIAIVIYERWSLRDLGMRLDTFRESLVPYTVFTILGVFAIIVFARALERGISPSWSESSHFVYFAFIPISLFQEFLYRSFLVSRLRVLFSSMFLVVFVNALLFTFLHTLYPFTIVNLPIIFFGGLGFAFLYYRCPNFWLVSFSHVVLNVVAVLFCFFSFTVDC